MSVAASFTPPRLDPAALTTIAAGLAAVTVPWELHAGELQETAVAGDALLVRHLRAGRTIGFAPGHIHAVANPTTRLATSVHVYSPPLSDMGFYDRGGDGALVARPA